MRLRLARAQRDPASASSSATYLTVSENSPMETRATAIAFSYTVGTAVGGGTGPLLPACQAGCSRVR